MNFSRMILSSSFACQTASDSHSMAFTRRRIVQSTTNLETKSSFARIPEGHHEWFRYQTLLKLLSFVSGNHYGACQEHVARKDVASLKPGDLSSLLYSSTCQ